MFYTIVTIIWLLPAITFAISLTAGLLLTASLLSYKKNSNRPVNRSRRTMEVS